VLNEVEQLGCRGGFVYLGDVMIQGLPHDYQKKLAELNDHNVPFEVIAGLIDQAL
jgi:hypothetical protein